MCQIKNYLSRLEHRVESVAVMTNDIQSWKEYLLEELRISRVYFITDGCSDEATDARINCLSINEARDTHLAVDAIIIERGCLQQYKQLQDINATYFIATLNQTEDYFALWEQARERFQAIYMVRDKEAAPRDRDANDCEVLEWKREAEQMELSVILPVYNVEKYLPQCIESLTQWRAPYVEFLFVNDGSTDNSAQVIEAYAAKDSRIRLFNKTNGGCASARNYGIENAKGRYIGFVDSDDFVDAQMFPKLLSRALMGNYELSYCGYREFYEDTGDSEPVLNDCLGEPYLSGTYREDKVQKLVINTRVAIWRCIYKRSLLERRKLRFHEDLKRFDDLPFRIECMFSAKSAVCVPEYLYYYRLGRKGQDVSCRDERLWVHFKIFEYLDAFVEPMRDRRLLDYLQIVKVNTHGYALGRIEKKYAKQYKKEAAAQLDHYAGTFRTLCLLMVYGGRSHIGWYLRRG